MFAGGTGRDSGFESYPAATSYGRIVADVDASRVEAI